MKNTSLSRKTRAISSLAMSTSGLKLLKSKENLALAPYDDQTGKEVSNWVAGATIGYGHLIDKSEWEQYKNGISQAQADTLFKSDLSPFVSTVRTSIKAEVSQEQFDALIILAFNIGRSAFSQSSVATLVNDPTAVTGYSSLKSAWMAWSKSQGKEMKGLVNRRMAEWNLYERGTYQ
jgi:lysozyme